jgi:hypothetical protein
MTSTNIAEDTRGELRPAYEVIQRQVGHLACGDLVVEPVLGEVRVVHVAEFGYDGVRGRRQLQVHSGHGRRAEHRRPIVPD